MNKIMKLFLTLLLALLCLQITFTLLKALFFLALGVLSVLLILGILGTVLYSNFKTSKSNVNNKRISSRIQVGRINKSTAFRVYDENDLLLDIIEYPIGTSVIIEPNESEYKSLLNVSLYNNTTNNKVTAFVEEEDVDIIY